MAPSQFGEANQTCVLSVLLPVRNEGVNLKIMIRILKAALVVPSEIVVVYDEPGDDSVALLTEMSFPDVLLVRNTLGRGVANAIRAGVSAAKGKYVLIFAADEVGPVIAIDDMLALMDQGCDLVSCTRYAFGGRRLGGSLIGGVLSRLANRLFRLLSGLKLTDSTTGIKMFRKSLMNELSLEARPIGWAVAFELAIKAQLAGKQLGEVPIISVDRLYGGKSTFSLGPWLVEYLRWFVRGLKDVRKNRGNLKQLPILRLPRPPASKL